MRLHSAGRTIGFCFALLGATAATAAIGRAQDDFKASLPPHTLFYASAPNFETWLANFKTAPLHKIWVEEEVQEFFADLGTLVKKKMDEAFQQGKQMHAAGALPVDPEELKKVRVKSASLAVTDLTIPSGADKPGMFSLVLCLDFGDTAPIVQKALETVIQMGMAQAGESGPKLETKEVGGTKIQYVRPPEGDQAAQMMPTFGVGWVFIGGKMMVGTDVQRLGDIVTALSGQKPAASLSTDPAYREVTAQVRAATSDLEVFMRPSAFIDACLAGLRLAATMNPGDMGDVDMAGVERAVKALGLGALRGMGYASGYSGGKGVSQSYLLCPAEERRGFTALGSSAPISRDRLAWIPKAAGSFSIAKLGEMEAFYTALLDAVEAYNPEFRKLAEAQIQGLEQQLGFQFKKELFGAFGSDLIFYSMPVAGLMATPEMVVMLECKNADRTLEVLKKLASLSEGHVTIADNKVDGVDFHSISIVVDEMAGGIDPMGMIEPQFSFKNGFLVFGLSRSDVKGALKRIGGEGGEDVRSNPAFKPYLDQLPAEVSSISFTDVATTFDGLYGQLSGVMGMVPIPGDVPIDLALLPSSSTITKHLFGSVAWSTIDKKGVAGYAIGPLGPELVALVVLGIGGGIVAGIVARHN